MGLGALGLLVVLVGIEHVYEDCLSIHGLVKRLRGAGAIGILGCVLFVIIRLFLRALGLALPVAAQLVVDQLIGRKRRLPRARIELEDFLHLILVHLLTHVSLFLARGRTG